MLDYRVSYRTPVAVGDAVVTAPGIVAAQAIATQAVHILTGHPIDTIAILAVAEHPAGRTLWMADQEAPDHVGT